MHSGLIRKGKNMAAAKPGERKLQILQTVAEMLEQPKSEKITTAALAAKLDISEADDFRAGNKNYCG
jgi:TetR/AcrR family transcriptional regulator